MFSKGDLVEISIPKTEDPDWADIVKEIPRDYYRTRLHLNGQIGEVVEVLSSKTILLSIGPKWVFYSNHLKKVYGF